MRRRAAPSTPQSYRPVPPTPIAPATSAAATTGEDARLTHSGIDYQELRSALGYRRAGFEGFGP